MRNTPIAPRQSGQNFSRLVLVALSLLLAYSMCVSCGKVGQPAPPERIRLRITDLSAVQRGSRIVLRWSSPPLGLKENNIQYVERADIYRLKEQQDQEPTLDPDEYSDQAEPIGFIARDTIVQQNNELGSLEFSDVLSIRGPADVNNIRLRYAIRYTNKRGQQGPFSNTVAIEPSNVVANSPADLTVADKAQDEVALEWKAPESDIDGKRPADVVGYNVYRRTAKDQKNIVLLNQRPVIGTTFVDTKFRYRTHYVYMVRALSTGDRGLIESTDSQSVPWTPTDTFKPSAPNPVSIASANGTISLFWPTNPERDVVGYNVYRAETADGAPSDWVKLTRTPLTLVTFRDDKVKLGQRYYYRVTAIDRFDNESDPSTIVSQVANP